jgi:hypothetical protein
MQKHTLTVGREGEGKEGERQRGREEEKDADMQAKTTCSSGNLDSDVC